MRPLTTCATFSPSAVRAARIASGSLVGSFRRWRAFSSVTSAWETPVATVVVEVESAGGVGNLVKHWPLLTAKPRRKRLAILHVFQLNSDADYIAHRRLWQFLVERTCEYL